MRYTHADIMKSISLFGLITVKARTQVCVGEERYMSLERMLAKSLRANYLTLGDLNRK